MINMVALMGRLTYEPELKSTPNGFALFVFKLLAIETIKSKAKKDKPILSTVLLGARLLNLFQDIFTRVL